MFGVVYEILESSCKNYMYVLLSSSFCSWDGETCLVGLYYNFSWQRQKKKHHVHAAAGWAMLILNGASAVSFTTQKCLENIPIGIFWTFYTTTLVSQMTVVG